MHTAAQPPAPAFQGTVDLPGVHLWYTDSGGSGAPVVLLHANTGTSESWEPNTPGLVAAGYRAIAFDRRGWGRSVADPATGPQPGSVAEDLHALVEHLHLDRFHLVGIAGGGYVAYDYALWHPERLRSLVVAASGGGITEPDYAAAGLRRIRLPGFADWPAEYREVSMGYLSTNPTGTARWLEIHEHAHPSGSSAPPMRGTVTLAGLQTIQLPALLMPGDNDLTSPPYVMRVQAQYLPKVQFVLIPEAGHSVNWERPDLFNSTVLEFVGNY